MALGVANADEGGSQPINLLPDDFWEDELQVDINSDLVPNALAGLGFGSIEETAIAASMGAKRGIVTMLDNPVTGGSGSLPGSADPQFVYHKNPANGLYFGGEGAIASVPFLLKNMNNPELGSIFEKQYGKPDVLGEMYLTDLADQYTEQTENLMRALAFTSLNNNFMQEVSQYVYAKLPSAPVTLDLLVPAMDVSLSLPGTDRNLLAYAQGLSMAFEAPRVAAAIASRNNAGKVAPKDPTIWEIQSQLAYDLGRAHLTGATFIPGPIGWAAAVTDTAIALRNGEIDAKSLVASGATTIFATALTRGRASSFVTAKNVSAVPNSVSLSGPRLLPTEGNVGTYRDLIAAGSKGDNITPNHIPSANRMAREGISRGDGISINMEQPVPGVGGRHRATFTYGTSADINMTPRDALAAGVWDARGIYMNDGLYTPQIRSSLQELILLNKTRHPTVFVKPGQ